MNRNKQSIQLFSFKLKPQLDAYISLHSTTHKKVKLQGWSPIGCSTLLVTVKLRAPLGMRCGPSLDRVLQSSEIANLTSLHRVPIWIEYSVGDCSCYNN